jgi:hypothetical protein
MSDSNKMPTVHFSTQKSIVDLKSIKKKFFVSKAEKSEIELKNGEAGEELLGIDLPPNVDNYRNVLSINYKGSATRPTLNELRVRLNPLKRTTRPSVQLSCLSRTSKSPSPRQRPCWSRASRVAPTRQSSSAG